MILRQEKENFQRDRYEKSVIFTFSSIWVCERGGGGGGRKCRIRGVIHFSSQKISWFGTAPKFNYSRVILEHPQAPLRD